MAAAVCVLTARGMSAIASVALSGADAKEVLEEIFQSSSRKKVALSPADFCHGSIMDGDRVIDEVLVGREGQERFVIHCHGNPLLVEQIVKLCQSKGALLVDAERFSSQQSAACLQNTIGAEAKLAMQKSATLLGVKILQGQINAGLSRWAAGIQANIDMLDIAEIHKQCKDILDRSQIANRIINGVRIVIAGAPNSGKSTLLNCLSGRQETIVSDIAGTTRDWVSVTCHMGPVRAEFIDTAGLDEALAGKDDIEQTAQAITKDLLESCDLIVYLQDATKTNPLLKIESEKPFICVLNKCDLIQEYKDSGTQELKPIQISAKNNTGIDKLVDAILNALQVDEIMIGDAIAFTPRQCNILSQLARTEAMSAVGSLIKKLLSDLAE